MKKSVATKAVALSAGLAILGLLAGCTADTDAVTTDTYNHGLAWEEGFGYSQGYRVGDTVYVSGQLAHDEAGDLIGADDIEAQAEATFANIDLVLEGLGATRNQVVETTVLIVGVEENFSAVSAAHADYFGDHRPASTTMGVTELALPGQLLEIAVVARLDAPK